MRAAVLILALVLIACGPGESTPEPTVPFEFGQRDRGPVAITDPETPTIRPTNTPPPPPTALPTDAHLIPIVVREFEEPLPYDLSEWKHWTDKDEDCQNTRQEVLIEESRIPVTFTDEDECRVATGEWLDPYTNTIVTDPSKLDIDHMVPLANAHKSGAWGWPAHRKEWYANDLRISMQLIAVTASANHSKGGRGPDEWRPPNEDYWCTYAEDWHQVKRLWDLPLTPAEVEALREMFATCPYKVAMIEHPTDYVLPDDDEDRTPPPSPTPYVYGSCEEAERHGVVARVKGSKGPGKGFPAKWVPSARDGDGDGIVCEK